MLKSKKILVTAGPTHEYLDDIRFIGNRSSGKQGVEIAKCLQKLEADVTLVIGPVNLELAGLNKVFRVESAMQMLMLTKTGKVAHDYIVSYLSETQKSTLL